MPDRSAHLGSSEWREAFEKRLRLQAKLHRLTRFRALAASEPRFIDGNRCIYLVDGQDHLAWMLAAIASARRRVDLEMYIVRADEVGALVRDALANAAGRGVVVRFMYDSIGSGELTHDFLEPMRVAGVHLVEFHPFAPWRLRIGRLGRKQSWEPNHRDHRKLLVCDVPLDWATAAADGAPKPLPPDADPTPYGPSAVLAITGGRNIAEEYLGLPPGGGQWRDSGLVVLGPVGRVLGEMFDAMWVHAAGPVVEAPPLDSPAMGTCAILPLGSQPGHINLLQWAMARVATSTVRELRISCAYFIPSLRWRRALHAVAKRTNACKVVIPLHNDIPVVAAASRHFLGALLRGGVEIYRYAREVLHDKTIVYDRAVTLIGSSNVDQRSFRLNYELSLLIVGGGLAEIVAQFHERDIEGSEPYTLAAWKARPWWGRLHDWFWSLFRNQL